MIADLEYQIIAALQTVFDRFGWFGVAGMMAFENATSITPSEVILGLAGWMLLAANNAPPAMIFVGGLYAALGSTAGAAFTYWMARLGGRPVVDRVARWFRLDPNYITRAEAQFHRGGLGLVLVLFGRVLPGVRTLITIPAGLARMPFLRFSTYTFIGTYVWCTLLIGFGYAVGHEWPLISGWVKQFAPWLFAGVVALGGLWLMARRLLRRHIRPALVPVEADEEE